MKIILFFVGTSSKKCTIFHITPMSDHAYYEAFRLFRKKGYKVSILYLVIHKTNFIMTKLINTILPLLYYRSPIELFCPASKEGRMCQMLISENLQRNIQN